MAGVDIISDTTGKEIVQALNSLVKGSGASEAIASRTEYGIRFALDSDGNMASTPEGTRVTRYDGAITEWSPNFTANIGDGSAVASVNENDFDLIDMFAPTLWKDEAGNVFRRFEPFYWGRQKLGGYVYIWVCKTKLYSFYKKPKAFTYKGSDCYVDIGVYEGSWETIEETTYLASKSGKNPAHNATATVFNTRAKAWETYLDVDTDKEWYGFTQVSEITEILQPLLQIMFGTRDAQSVYYGVRNYSSSAEYAVVAYDEDTMTLYFETDVTSNFRVGATANINAGTSSEDYYRRITALGTVTGTVSETTFTEDEGGSTYYYVTIEGDSFPETPTSICARPIFTGETDVIEATHGTLLNSGKYSFKVLGVENIYGNIWKQMHDVRVNEYVPYRRKDVYTFTEFSTSDYETYYEAANYTVAETPSSYVKEIGYDESMPDVQFPTIVGGSSSTYYCDGYYVNSGARTVYFGGPLNDGGNCGLFYWGLNSSVAYSGWSCGARLSHRALLGG